jgi:hypothetical protein
MPQLERIPEWVKADGFHVDVVWQSLHSLVVGMWFVALPVAVPPLWQVVQPEVMPLWLKVAGTQAVVL